MDKVIEIMKSLDDGVGPYACPLCSRSFLTGPEKGKHLESVHGYETLDVTPEAA